MTRQETSPDNRKAKNRGSRKRVRLAMILVMGLAVWAGGRAWGQMAKFDDRYERIDALETKLAETMKTNENLNREIDRLNDPEYREEKARKELHLSKPGETVFDVPRASP